MNQAATIEKESLWGRDFILVCVNNFLAFFSVYLIIPILPLFLEEEMGYSNFLIGALMSMMVMAALLRPFLGSVSDIRGRKAILVWGTFLLGASTFPYVAFTTALPLFVVRLLNGIGLAAFHTAAYAMVGDLVPQSRRLHGIAIFFISVDAAIGLAPIVAEEIRVHWGYNVVYIIAGIVAMLAFLVSLFIREAKKSGRAVGTSGRMWMKPTSLQRAIFILVAGYTLTLGVLSTFIVLSSKEVGIEDGELFFTVFAATLIIFRLVVGKRADWFPRRPLILISGIIVLVGMVVIAYSHSLTLLILGSLVYALGFAYLPTTLSALLLDHTRVADWGVMLGMFMAVFDIGIGVGSLAMGPIADAWNYTAMYLAGGAIAFITLVYFFLSTSELKGERGGKREEEGPPIAPYTET